MNKKLLLLAVLGCLLYNQGNAQSPGTESPALNPDQEGSNSIHKKGAFFITPYYEYNQFKTLELVKHTNWYSLAEGKSYEEFPQEDLDSYNEDYGTEYQSGMAGLKIGYQILDGFGINVYAGATRFNFKSWVSDNNTQYLSSQYPAVSFGLALDYNKIIAKKIILIASISNNYTITSAPVVKINSSNKILSSTLRAMYWEIDAAAAYPLGRFLPFAGVGFTQQFVKSAYTEQILTTEADGTDFYDEIKLESHYLGSAFYGFAGIEFRLKQDVSLLMKSSFPDPYRATLGFRIIL